MARMIDQYGTQAWQSYALITAARNEAALIEGTIRSVIAQTIQPLKWVIVSDGSTDGTDEIVSRYAEEYCWIELLRMPPRKERHFGGKALAVKAALKRLHGAPYEVIACLDADMTFERDYFEYLLERLALDPRLGVVGTPYRDATSEIYDFRFMNLEHVSGACQVFRRACFEGVGGYPVVKGGAIDSIATLTARMKGWQTRTFTEKIALHHRAVGTAQGGQIRARFNMGKRDYAIGNHPVWQICRGAYQLTRRPYVVRGLALMAGYLWSVVSRAEQPVQGELKRFRRKEQMERLVSLFGRGSSRDGDAVVQSRHEVIG